LDDNIQRISEASHDDTLTFVYLTSHAASGQVDHFVIDTYDSMGYQELLDKLDTIKGKKVVLAFLCYSGTLIDVFRERGTSEDYVILTSANNKEEDWNWGRRDLDDLFRNNLLRKGRLSDLRIPRTVKVDRSSRQHPQMVGSFDVIL